MIIAKSMSYKMYPSKYVWGEKRVTQRYLHLYRHGCKSKDNAALKRDMLRKISDIKSQVWNRQAVTVITQHIREL